MTWRWPALDWRDPPPYMGGTSELATLELALRAQLWSFATADDVTVIGGKVTQWNDAVLLAGAKYPNARTLNAAHAYVQASSVLQVATPLGVPALQGARAAVFPGTAYYRSILTGAQWAFASDGTGVEVWTVFISRTNVNSTLWATAAFPGTQVLCSGGTAFYQVTSSGASLFFAGGACALNVPTYADDTYGAAFSPQWQALAKTVVAASGAAGAPAATNATPLTIGGNAAGAMLATADIACVMVANRRDPALRAQVQRYMFLKYGLS